MSTIPYLKTPAVARLLETSYSRLMSLVRWEYIPAPAKDSSGDYVWTDADVERARAVLAERRAKCVATISAE